MMTNSLKLKLAKIYNIIYIYPPSAAAQRQRIDAAREELVARLGLRESTGGVAEADLARFKMQGVVGYAAGIVEAADIARGSGGQPPSSSAAGPDPGAEAKAGTKRPREGEASGGNSALEAMLGCADICGLFFFFFLLLALSV
jgi:hypothetical protein